MTDFFTKPLDSLDINDIYGLKDTPEGQVFEIKESLPTKKGEDDKWLAKEDKRRKGPGDFAKHAIFRELVAFANAEGGWLVIGLKETGDHPKRVEDVSPVPDCHETRNDNRKLTTCDNRILTTLNHV